MPAALSTSARSRVRSSAPALHRTRVHHCRPSVRCPRVHENLRAGLEWSLAEAETGGGLRLCGALQRFWWTRGHLTEGRQWCTRVLCKAGAEERTRERAYVLNAAGVLSYHQGDYPAARALYEESLAIRRGLGDRFGIAGSLGNLGDLAVT